MMPISARRRSTAGVLGALLAIIALFGTTGCHLDSTASQGSGTGFPSRPLTIIAAGDLGAASIRRRAVGASHERRRGRAAGHRREQRGRRWQPGRADMLGRQNDGTTVVAESNRVFLNPILGTTDMTVDKFTALAQLTNDYLVWAVARARRTSPPRIFSTRSSRIRRR